MKKFESVAITEETHIGTAKRGIRRCANEAGFTERQLAEIEIAVKEMGSNAVKFGQGTGQIFFARMDAELEPAGLEIIYVDRGPGIQDVSMAVEDGFTTTGTLGAGLGAIKRMADEFHIFSNVKSQTRRLSAYGRTTHGTAIVFRKYVGSAREVKHRKALWGAMTRPSTGFEENGDAYMVKRVGDRLLLAMIDGLGHGLGALQAANEAVAAIEEFGSQPLESIIRSTHEALRPTRGAVLGLASVDCAAGVIEYAGIGNTDLRVLGGRSPIRFISLNGTLGSRLDRVKVFKEQLPKVATVIMSTDGISERWDLDSYPGLLGLHPQLLCAVVMRDYSRPNDDATILCGRLSF
ncbi:MAG TPA: ATP-binding protein [Blastocatellia bacterium]|nr:ATP-binding protein [Blastocatellia bacterium]